MLYTDKTRHHWDDDQIKGSYFWQGILLKIKIVLTWILNTKIFPWSSKKKLAQGHCNPLGTGTLWVKFKPNSVGKI